VCVYEVWEIFFFLLSVSLFASFVHFVHLLYLTHFFPTLVKKKVTAKERIGNENISLPRARAGRSLSSFLLSSRTHLCNNDISNSKLGVHVLCVNKNEEEEKKHRAVWLECKSRDR
jgi:hypothetical protein